MVACGGRKDFFTVAAHFAFPKGMQNGQHGKKELSRGKASA